MKAKKTKLDDKSERKSDLLGNAEVEDLTEVLLAESEFVHFSEDTKNDDSETRKRKIDEKSPTNIPEESSVAGDVVEDDQLRRRKRPWRQAIRHKAKREKVTASAPNNATDADNSLISIDDGSNSPAASISTISKRQKHKNRKKMQKLLKKVTQESDAVKEEVDGGAPKLRLDASYFRYLNEQLYTISSNEAAKIFSEDPSAFEAYHKGYQQQMKKWPVQPVDTIILDLSALPASSVIADIGCGDAKIASELGKQYKVHSFDLVAVNDRVTVANMANLPLENDSVDACVFCLSLMGTNIHHFLREAHRILKMGGKMKIAEVSSRFSNLNQFISAIEKLGFAFTRKKELGEKYFVLMTFQKSGRIENKRPLGLKLNPCLYKKRAGNKPSL